ncbi:MAG: hypothetical protein MJE66_07735 [Proteobacteria bacterium]|nr:hypothetical protein [Pseudomonadota bacterium]
MKPERPVSRRLRIALWTGTAAIALLLVSAGSASAKNDFANGFEDELGRIVARHAGALVLHGPAFAYGHYDRGYHDERRHHRKHRRHHRRWHHRRHHDHHGWHGRRHHRRDYHDWHHRRHHRRDYHRDRRRHRHHDDCGHAGVVTYERKVVKRHSDHRGDRRVVRTERHYRY